MIRTRLAAVLDAIGEWLVRAGGYLFDAAYCLDPSKDEELSHDPWPTEGHDKRCGSNPPPVTRKPMFNPPGQGSPERNCTGE